MEDNHQSDHQRFDLIKEKHTLGIEELVAIHLTVFTRNRNDFPIVCVR